MPSSGTIAAIGVLLLSGGVQPSSPSLSVLVLDSTGGALVGATCQLTGNGSDRVAQAGSDGRCRFGNIYAGAYRVSVELSGFDLRTVSVVVGSDGAAQTQVTLEPAVVSESVVVSATRVPTPISALPNTVTIVANQVLKQRTATSVTTSPASWSRTSPVSRQA
jgi:hypothetical protein